MVVPIATCSFSSDIGVYLEVYLAFLPLRLRHHPKTAKQG